jgi:hypothetical protein
LVLTYHAVVSIAVPIALAEITRPAVRTTPWLRTPGLAVTAVAALLGFGLVRLIPLSVDLHYLMPWSDDIVIGRLVVLVAVVALRGLGPVACWARVPRCRHRWSSRCWPSWPRWCSSAC